MSEIFEQMLQQHTIEGDNDRKNALYEVMQQVVLSGLYRGGFFKEAAFYGGTCLRIFHGLRRYSEDMDFSLLAPDPAFRFEDYFSAVVEEFKLAGKDVEIKMKHKGQPSAIESAFLKESSDVFDIGFTTEKRQKVKIEVDIDPPPKFTTEMRVLNEPRSCIIRAYTLTDLFAGKVSAALFRKWKHRVKGRDWYDVVWYIAKHVPLDLAHLVERAKESAPDADVSTPEKVLAAFDARIDAIDFENARADVEPYVMDKSELDIWCAEFFRQMVRKIEFA